MFGSQFGLCLSLLSFFFMYHAIGLGSPDQTKESCPHTCCRRGFRHRLLRKLQNAAPLSVELRGISNGKGALFKSVIRNR